MYKHILVPTQGLDNEAPVYAAALQIAKLHGGHISFLHVKVDVTDTLLAMTAGGMGAGAAIQDVIDRLQEDITAAERRTWEKFGAFCQQAGIRPDAQPGDGLSAELVVETGNEGQWLAEHGRFVDLIVVGRPDTGHPESVEVALMDSGKPVLIAPTNASQSLVGTIAIAWKDTVEAARAVAAAMPLIEAAQAVVILSVEEKHSDATSAETCEKLARSLRWHNPTTRVQHVKGDGRAPVETLLDAAGACATDLLVMGGYSHSRLREVVFGGFTQRILDKAELPVLMVH